MKTKQQIEAVMKGLRAELINDQHDEADQRVAFAMECVLGWVIRKPKAGDYVDDQSNVEAAIENACINAAFIRRDFENKARTRKANRTQ